MSYNLIFCSNNGINVYILMKNHGMGTHNDKKCAVNSTGYAPNIPQPIKPIPPVDLYLDFEKSIWKTQVR